jgi:hypothetical protein
MSHRATPELRDGQKLTAQSARETPRIGALTDRLRGVYVTRVNDGAGLLNGKDHVTRNFEMPPICLEAANEIERLEIELSQERERGRWILTSETKPQHMLPVLIYASVHGETTMAVAMWNGIGWWMDGGALLPKVKVTHWQPLPSAPKE